MITLPPAAMAAANTSSASLRTDLDACNVIWTSPSNSSAGSMPIGNGELCANVWVEPDGDVRLLLARTDSWSEICRLLKLARVRIHLEPQIGIKTGSAFKQELRLQDGKIQITLGESVLTVFADSESATIWISARSQSPVSVRVSLEDWRTEDRELPVAEQTSAWAMQGAPFPLIESADHVVQDPNKIIWYHRNISSCIPFTLQHQSLTGLAGTYDPLLHRTFGGEIQGEGLVSNGGSSLKQEKASRRFECRITTHTGQAPSVEAWRTELDAQAEKAGSITAAQTRTAANWRKFWDRSWIYVSGRDVAKAAEVTRGYTLQRYITACQGRGAYPIKFNGGLFTVEPAASGRPYNPDWRNWGDSYWFQNTRFMYHPMLASGDTEMMDPFFRLYENARPLAEARAMAYHGCEGSYYPETMTLFGTYANSDYGWIREGLQPNDVQCMYWRYAWNQGPELVSLMLDYYDYTGDAAFLHSRLLPMATSVLKYFRSRFKTDSEGKLVISPAQAVETYWFDVVNDAPTVAGLRAITARLAALPAKSMNADQRSLVEQMAKCCPALPTEPGRDGLTKLSPAAKYKNQTSNVENPELYPVFPFRLCTVGTADVEVGRRAYAERKNHLDAGWGYDGNVAALLGLTDEAERILTVKVENSNPAYRFPATWGPNYDWLPDQNHGGNLLLTTQLMLLQAEGRSIRLLPAWPKAWDVTFRLHAPLRTTVEGEYRDGKLMKLNVTPASRLKDVTLPLGISKP